MDQTQTPEPEILASVDDALDRLIAFEPTTCPVISLYLNTQSDKHGRDAFGQFVRKELAARLKTLPTSTPQHQSFQQDIEKIQSYLETALNASANGVAIFACSAAGLFETIQLNAPIDEHRIYVYNQPNLYHLARLDDEYPRYAAVVTDANSARIFVFGLGEMLETEMVKGRKVQRVKVGGWSQARYQRRVSNAHQSHAKEVVDRLDQIVKDDRIQYIILAGDPQIVPVLQQELPKHLAEKVVDAMKLDVKASDQTVLQTTLDRMREEDAKSDAEKVDRLLNAYRAQGLACAGPEATLEALANGQVDELLISASLEQSHPEEETVDALVAPEVPDSTGGTDSEEPRSVLLPDLLVTKAKQTDSTVTFIEDPALLESVGGVGAFLRWR